MTYSSMDNDMQRAEYVYLFLKVYTLDTYKHARVKGFVVVWLVKIL